MKLAFTTLGCPTWDLDTIISTAVKLGFDGVDFRGYRGDLEIAQMPEFTTAAQTTARRFADAGLEVPCFSSSAFAFSKTREDLEKAIREVKDYAEICQHFQAPFIRVFGGSIGDTPREDAIDKMAENLVEMLAAIDDFPAVQILIETHDAWTNSHHLAAVMEKVDSERLGVVWDTHHPYRTTGEPPRDSWNNLAKWVRNTHWKDSYVEPEAKRGYQLCLLGDGDVPLQEIFSILETNGYDGYLTLEWEKKWCPEIDEPEIAFPRYVEYMRKLMG